MTNGADPPSADSDPMIVAWTSEHPVVFALINAAAFCVLGWALSGRLIAAVPGLFIGLIQWLIWRRGGPGLKWNRRLRAAERR